MTTFRQNLLTPTGRLVAGSLYKPQTTDAEGKPLVVKTGPDIGKPTQRYFFALAVPKEPGHAHWADTTWGRTIWAVGHASFPDGQAQRPDFAWKIIDGDSVVPNKKGIKPNAREGYPGNWVISLSSSFAPRIYNRDGTAAIPEPDAVKIGYYVQVAGTVDGNESSNQPGVYINHSMVALQGYGPEIVFGPDPTSVGFGGGAAPAGMSSAPVGAMTAPPQGAPAAWNGVPAGIPPLPAYAAPAAPPALPAIPGAPPPPAGLALPTAVTPHPGFLTAPPGMAPAPMMAPAAPPPPPAVPTAPLSGGPTMTAKAGGMPYMQWIAAGWNDATLRANGYMI